LTYNATTNGNWVATKSHAVPKAAKSTAVKGPPSGPTKLLLYYTKAKDGGGRRVNRGMQISKWTMMPCNIPCKVAGGYDELDLFLCHNNEVLHDNIHYIFGHVYQMNIFSSVFIKLANSSHEIYVDLKKGADSPLILLL
jgi:hypothetical protein